VLMSTEWYYVRNGVQTGPVSTAELKQLADGGQLRPEDLVWQDGMRDWAQAGKVKGLFEAKPAPAAAPAPTAPAAATPAATQPVAAVAQPVVAAPAQAVASVRTGAARPAPSKHLFDFAIGVARRTTGEAMVQSAGRLLGAIGYYGLYLAALVAVVLGVAFGVLEQSPSKAAIGVAFGLLLLAEQYAVGRFLGALEQVGSASAGRLATTAVLDCMAVLAVGFGLASLVLVSFAAVRLGCYLWIVPAAGSLVVCKYWALLAIHPGALGIRVTPDAVIPATEEALGLGSFFLQSLARVVPAALCVGVLWGTARLLYACVLAFAPPGEAEAVRMLQAAGQGVPGAASKTFFANMAASNGILILVVAAALPVLAYLLYLKLNLLLDVARAILQVPSRLDRWTSTAGDSQDE